MNHIDTMKLALEALEGALSDDKPYIEKSKQAVTALREALAEQPAQQQEPEIVQRVKRRTGKTIRTARNPNITARECIELADWIAANTSPPAQRKPQEACPTCGEYEPRTGTCGTSPNDKRALCNRNAPQPAQQEPVATVVSESGDPNVSMSWRHEPALPVGAKLYTSPPAQRKPWVGLTDDDKCVKELYESDTDPEWIDGYTAGLKDAENKLRRYNAQPALVVEQLNPVAEGKCEICNDPSNLVIDHCHNSKDVRGILCWSCNVALGHFKDSEERLTSALKYLCKFKQNTQTL